MTITISRRLLTMVISAVVALAAVITIAACSSSSTNGNAAESSVQGAISAAMLANQPPDFFPTSAYRGEIIEIEAIQALGSPTTSFFFPEGTTVVMSANGPKFSAPPLKVCPSEGEPVPNTASLTNPLQAVGLDGVSGITSVGQMDPNGGYVAGSSTGTNVLCDNATGGVRLSYWEGPVFAESGTAVWSETQGIVDVGNNTLPVCVIRTAQDGDGTGITAGDTYYHCTDSTGKAINSSPTSGPGGKPLPTATRSAS